MKDEDLKDEDLDEILIKLANRAAEDGMPELWTDMTDRKQFFEEIKQEILQWRRDSVLKIPDQLLGMNISGVWMPRSELDKISIQDLRLALDEIANSLTKGDGDE